MSPQGTSADRIRRASDADEETRYRAVPLLDPAVAEELGTLLARLADPSWRVRTAAVERLAAPGDPAAVVPPLLDRLVGPGGIGEREAAGAALARIGAPAVPGLVERLGSEEAELRQAAAGVLGEIRDRRALAALTARLSDPEPNVRGAAADALGRTGGPEAVATLLAAVDSDDAGLRGAALQALAAQRTAPTAQQLRRLVADRATRRSALRLVGFSDEPEAHALLVQGLTEPARSAWMAALAALGTLRARWPLQALQPVARGLREAAVGAPELAARFEEGLTSDEPFVPVGAATALGWLGGARQAAALARLAEDDRYRPLVEETLELLPQTVQVQAALFDALGSLTPPAMVTVVGAMARAGNEAAFRLLAARLSDPEPQVRAEAVTMLGRLGDGRGVEPLAAALADEDPTVAVLAAAAVVRIGQEDERGREVVLRECRARLESGAAPALLRVVGALGGAGDVPLLRRLLAGGAEPIRAAVAAAAAALGARGVLREADVPELAHALGDRSRQVRGAAARALAELGRAAASRGGAAVGRAALAALESALADPEPSVQANAAEALGSCGGPGAGPALAALVSGGEAPPVVVVAALHGLVALGAASRTLVEAALAHPDPEVAKEAVAAAAHLDGEDGRALLRSAARSPRWDVRNAVARAITERGDPGLADLAREQAASEEDPLVAKAFAAAAEALGQRG